MNKLYSNVLKFEIIDNMISILDLELITIWKIKNVFRNIFILYNYITIYNVITFISVTCFYHCIMLIMIVIVILLTYCKFLK